MSRCDGIRVGVVGVGYWGAKHIRVLRSSTGVAAVVGIDERFSGLGTGPPTRTEGGIAAYGSIEEALPWVDALVIATPPSSHARLGMQAIAAGKHVLIEKPLATSAAEARSLVDAAAAAGVMLMPGHTLEHNAAVHKLRDLIHSGELGQIYYLDCERLNLGLYQPDVGAILDLAPHDISIANFILGSRPTTVTAWGSRHVHSTYEDVAHLLLDYGDIGARAHVHVSWLSPRKVRRVTVVGSKKMAVYDDLLADDRIRIHDKSAIPAETHDGPLSRVAYHWGDVVSPHIQFAEPLTVQDQHFVDCIRGEACLATDGTSGLAVVQVLESAQESVLRQRPVALAGRDQEAAYTRPHL